MSNLNTLRVEYSEDNEVTWNVITTTFWIATTRKYRIARISGTGNVNWKLWCLKPILPTLENEITEVLGSILNGNTYSSTFTISRPLGDPVNYSSGLLYLFPQNEAYNTNPYQVISPINVSYAEPQPPTPPTPVPCFLEGTKIICKENGIEKYIPVEKIRSGTLVKTKNDGYKPVALIGKRDIKNSGNNERTKDRLYKCSPSKYDDLDEDLYITGCHSILTDSLTDVQKEKTIELLGDTFVTDKKYRLMACVDERAEPWNSEGIYTIYHFALESEDDGINYGVYANGVLLVETCSIRYLKNKSEMHFL